MKRRVLSLALAISMVLAMLPVQVLAAYLREQTTVYLPIVADEAGVPGSNVSLFSNGTTIVYASTSAISVELPELALPSDAAPSSSTGARIQALNSAGTVVGQTAGFSIYDSTTALSPRTLFFMEPLSEGSYTLQLVSGDAEAVTALKLDAALSVVDAPVITGGYMRLTAGVSPSELTLYISGYDGDPSVYSFSLLDAETGATIACAAELSDVYDYGNGRSRLTYSLTPKAALEASRDYYLAIEVTSGSLYSSASSISSTAYGSGTASGIAILDVSPDDAVTGGLTMTVGGVAEDTDYTIQASLNYSDTDLLYSGTSQPELEESGNGVFSVTLIRNGLQLPLSAYENATITLFVSDENGNYDQYYFRPETNDISQYADLELTQTGENSYAFVLTGCNLLLDLYEQTEALVFDLKYYDSTARKYVTVSTACPVVEKQASTEDGDAYFTFSGTLTTNTALLSDTYYYLFCGEDSLAGCRLTAADSADTVLDISYFSLRQQDYHTKALYFNFGYLPVEVTLRNSEDTASISLYDVTADQVVSSSPAVPGSRNDNAGGYEFLFLIPEPKAMDTSHHYTFRITSGEETVDAESYSSYYRSLGYTAAVQEPSYYNAETPVFVGDTELTFSFYANSMRNMSKDALKEELSNIVHQASETGLSFHSIRYTYADNHWYATLQLTSGLKLGDYSYNGNRSFTALAADTVVLGRAYYKKDKLTISDCANLPEGAYTGVLYDTSADTYKKVSDLTLTRVDASTLSSAAALGDGSYALEVRAGGVYLGTVSISVSESTDTPAGAVIRGYGLVYYASGDHYSYDEIYYLTDSQKIFLDTYLDGYAYVRFSEDKSFEGVSYQPIRQYYDQELTLSAGNGVKTIYVQFKQSSGTESAVYTWSCKKVESLTSPAIVSAEILVGGTSTSRVPNNSEFVLSLVSASQLNSVYALFVEADGSEYYEEYTLSYVEETETGYLFQCTLDSGDWPFDYYDFTAVNFYLTDFAGHKEYDTTTLPIAFGNIGLYLDAWGDEYTAYTNQTNFTVTGTATPGATVTITVNYNDEYTATADAKTGAFSIALTNLTEDDYSLHVKDSEGSSDYVELIVDQTAPVIDSLKAALADSGNAAVTWTYTEDNLKTFLLYRDDVLIKGSEGSYHRYTDTNYIAADASGATFTLIAVDNAGNRSEAKEVTVGDTEAPSAPGAPSLTSHSTKTITFNWTKASDNVAVYQYEIWRNDVLLTTLSYTNTSYTDTGLEEGNAYRYTLYALDRAGNKSAASETVSLSTATLVISDSTEWASEYLKEAYAETGVALQVKLDSSDSYHNLSKASVKLQYKTEAQTEWSDLTLYADSPFLFARSWMIEELEIGAYTVRFQVIDADGTEKTTAESTITISQDSISPKVTITSPIAGSTIGGGKVQTVKVSATDNVNVTTVELYYTAAGTEETRFATLTNPSSYNTTYLVTEELTAAAALASGKVTLKAKAYDKRGNVGETTLSFTLDNTAPAAPDSFRVTSDANKISVLWNKTVLEEDFSFFKVYRSTSADGTFELISTDPKANYYDDASTGIEAGVNYYYYVTAVDAFGNESDPTATDYGMMVNDTEAPTIVSYLPTSGTVIRHSQTLTISAEDNFKLKAVKAEYYDTATGAWVTIGEVQTNDKTGEVSIDWPVADLTPGSYQVRYSATDSVDLQSTAVTATYVVEDYTPPVSPVLSATAAHRAANLTWIYSGKTEHLHVFQVYRAEAEDGTYLLAGSTSKTAFNDDDLDVGTTYWYKVRAVDNYGSYAESTAVSVTPILSDTEDPVACITMQNPTIPMGASLSFDGSGSTDNDLIASYAWDFGDETAGSGKICPHTFTKAGAYIVKLTVTDAAGHMNSTSVTVIVVDLSVDTSYVYANFTVVDGADGTTPVSNAELQISSEDGSTPVATVTTDANGKVSVLLQKGAYTVYTIADGCYGRTSTVVVSEERGDIVIGLSGASAIKGSLTAAEMTLDEIIEAGIDTSDPDNQHVYRGALVLEFVKLEKTLDFNMYFNERGKVLGMSGAGGAGGGGGFGGGYSFDLGGGLCGTIYPASKNVFMIVYTEVCWLKEMFNVELVVINDSAVDTMDFTTATLDLPDGLSLASMKADAQNETISLGAIEPKGTATARWYVRGDKEGEYDLTANVKGVFTPNMEAFEVAFVTEKPIRVWAGSALHLYVEAEKYAAKGQNYRIGFRLENVSNKDLYNVSLDVLGGKILEEYDVADLEYEGDGGDLSGIWNGGEGAVFTEVLKPSESLSGMFKIVFDADFIEADATYLLNNMFMHTMDGSTTEINTTVSFMDREDLAIIVVPGIMGSELVTTAEGNQVWIPTEFDPYGEALMNGRYGDALKYLLLDLLSIRVSETNGNDEAKGFFGRKLESLRYALDALHVSIYDQEPFAKITVYDASSGETGTAGLCSTMINAMKSFTSNVYLFSYDWRNDNTIAAQKLNDLITTIRADETIEEVVIVAHSMGGLVSSSYAAQFGTEAVTNIITVGTPYLGTPQGTYMLELLDNSETIIGGALSKLYAWAATKIITKGLGLEGIQDIIAGELIEPIIDTLVAPGMSEDVEELMNLLGINTLVQHYHGLYQLLPSPAYGGYMLNEMYGYVLGQEHERIVLNNMMEHYAVNGQHIDLITQAYQFHTKLGELDDQVLLNDEKSYFIVGSGQRTLSYLVPENSYSTSFENSFKDMTVESGDGTVTEVSSTMRGMIPDERSLYIAAEHTPLFSASNTINAIKDLLFGDEAAFGATNSFEPLEPYTKIKAECPVELTITRENESLISDPFSCTDRTSFGELYRLGSDADIKIAFVDDSSYDLTIFATDAGTMDLTIDYHTGGENDQVKTVQFTNVPLVAGGEITAQITPNDGDPSSDNGLTLSLDNDADGTVDVILQPGDASNDDKDDKDDVNPSSPSSGKDSSQEDKLPEIETNVGGNIEADRNGDLIITPDTGFVIDEILINGKPVLIPADGILSGLKSSDHVQVTFAPANACTGSTACPSAKYTDVDITQWYHQSIDYAVANGLMNGTGANTFAPHATTSRGMIVTILWRLEGQPAAGACPFADVKAGSYYEQAIAWAAENGIVNGISTTVFKPDSTITREQFAAILYRYAKVYKGYDVSVGEDTDILSYADAFSISDYAFPALQWACGTGLMNGSGGALMPGDGATRAQAAAILYRFCTKIMN